MRDFKPRNSVAIILVKVLFPSGEQESGKDGVKCSASPRSVLFRFLIVPVQAVLGPFLLAFVVLSSVSQAQTSLQPERPTIGLVLAGGGAKGVAHVGVIKVLEEVGVEVDVIAGTSMGAIVGGLYAMGMSSEELEETVHSIDWENLFVDDAPRPQRSIRRKTDDFGFLAEPRLRLRDGTVQLPRGAIKGQKLNLELNRRFRPANGISNFDKLPRPFRAVATDLESGEEIVLAGGDLALAVRASMAFPGAFPPVELDGRILVDGGVVNNVPISVVRDMGADIIIVSNFSQTSVSAKELTSAVSILGRTIDIMFQRSQQDQIVSLGERHVLIVTDLGDIGTASFERAPETIALGEAAAREKMEQLVSLGRSEGRPAVLVTQRLSRRINSIFIETDAPLSLEVLRVRMKTQEGEAFDPDKIEEDLQRIYALEIFETVTYRVEPIGDDIDLHIFAKTNPAGKDFLRFGVTLQNDFGRDSSYDVGVSYTVPAINELNGEWRSTVVLGDRLGATTELYQPLDPGDSFFFQPRLSILDRDVNIFQDRRKVAETRVLEARASLRAGYNFNNELAVYGRVLRGFGDVRDTTGTGIVETGGFDTGALAAGLYYDSLDSLEFPRSGALVFGEYSLSSEDLGADSDFSTVRFSANIAESLDRHSLALGQFANLTLDGDVDAANLFELGGPFRLSGLIRNALSGNNALLSRAIYFYELERFGPSFLDTPLYAGMSIEYGNVFQDTDDIDFGNISSGHFTLVTAIQKAAINRFISL
jgi:NTE family protein